MWYQALSVLLLAFLPGTLIFRLPWAEPGRRAALAVEERVFWSVVLSAAFTSVLALGLAAGGWYRFDRLLWINAIACLLLVAAARGRLRLGRRAARVTWTALVPLALAAAAVWLNFRVPPSEYIQGGRDPGTYVVEGIQIAQRGSLIVRDDVAASVPPAYRDLFFPARGDPSYHSIRFMGFFLLDPDAGTVVGQFPHLYPVWVAVAYGVNGLSGARWVLGLWAVLGVLAVYFAGARIVGRAAAAAAAGLLALHVTQIWYARYPNAEIFLQALVFSGLLAFTRHQLDDDGFFGVVAVVLLVLGVFAHVTGVLAVGAVAVAAALGVVEGRRLPWLLLTGLTAGTALAALYLVTFLPPYFQAPLGFVRNLQPLHVASIAIGALGLLVLLRGARSAAIASRARVWIPVALVVIVWTSAAYAYFLRAPDGLLAAHDAEALRTFAAFYLTPYGLTAALLGFLVVARCSFWSGASLLLTATIFWLFFFYKIRIVPEHFWAARRFLAVILPAALLFVGAAAAFCGGVAPSGVRPSWLGDSRVRTIGAVAGLAFVGLLGWRFFSASRPILRHVEYAGLIPRLEELAARFGDEDLVLVESRGSSDLHVLAVPLSYIYARNTLVFATTTPDKRLVREFLDWAHDRYRRVFFIGGGGMALLSRTMTVAALDGERFQIPEYEAALNAYPRDVRQKEFDFGVYELLPTPVEATGFELDVGAADDLYVRRFHAKERHPNRFSFRWTRDVSYVSVLGTTPAHQTLTMWLDDGGRPPAAGPAEVEVFLNERRLGRIVAGPGLQAYRLSIPPELAAAIAESDDAAELRLVCTTWNPGRALGVADPRDVGVMVDRIEVR